MKILEVRDGIVKLESNDELSLSSFIKIDGNDKSYVAQVIQIKPAFHTAFAKILFLYDGGLKDYDKTSPSDESVVTEFTSEMIENSVKFKNPVIIGETISGTNNLALDFSAFDKKTLIVSDDLQCKNILVRNLTKQFNNLGKKVVIIDTLGTINADKYVAGKDFKLPLNRISLKFIFEDCLNDATAESKNTIVEIFRDLAEYSDTVPFVPFGALKDIVDDMVDHSHIFKLLVLKNKLSKYDKFGYFANTNDEVKKLERILKSDCSVIDVSMLDSIFQNQYISYLYESVADCEKVVVTELSNAVSKKTLKNIFDNDVATCFLTHSRFKYINDIQNLFENFVLFPSEDVNRLFSIYSTFLRSMEKDNYLAVGRGTGFMPFVLKAASYDAKAERQISDDEILDEIVRDKQDETLVETYDETEEASNEIIAEINEKSLDTITDIAENLETPKNIDMFGEDEEETTEQKDVVDALESEQEVISENVTELEEPTNPDESEPIISEGDVVKEALLEEPAETETDEIIEEQDLIIQSETEQSQEDEEIVEISEDLSEDIEVISDNQEDETAEKVIDEPEIAEKDTESGEVLNDLQERDVIPLNEEFTEDEIIELNPDDAAPDDILIDMSEEEADEDKVDEQIKQDVDKVYTTRKEEDFSDNDLDFIDELNSEADTLEEAQEDDGLLEELAEQGEIIEEYHSEELPQEEPDEAGEILETRNSSTPIVPVYDAEIPEEDLVESDPIQQGDSVTHVRFGSGVVEKLVKYGSKTLFMINFDNGGRRLLDPLLTEIKKA